MRTTITSCLGRVLDYKSQYDRLAKRAKISLRRQRDTVKYLVAGIRPKLTRLCEILKGHFDTGTQQEYDCSQSVSGFFVLLLRLAEEDFKMCHTLGISWDAPDHCRPRQEEEDLDGYTLANDNWYGSKEALGNLTTAVETNDPRVRNGATGTRTDRLEFKGWQEHDNEAEPSDETGSWVEREHSNEPQHDRPVTETDSENESARECEENETGETDWSNEEWSEENTTQAAENNDSISRKEKNEASTPQRAENIGNEYGFQEEKEESVQPRTDSENEGTWASHNEEENDQQMRRVEYENF